MPRTKTRQTDWKPGLGWARISGWWVTVWCITCLSWILFLSLILLFFKKNIIIVIIVVIAIVVIININNILLLKLFLSHSMSFIFFLSSSPFHVGDWMNSWVLLSCWLGLNHNRKVWWLQKQDVSRQYSLGTDTFHPAYLPDFHCPSKAPVQIPSSSAKAPLNWLQMDMCQLRTEFFSCVPQALQESSWSAVNTHLAAGMSPGLHRTCPAVLELSAVPVWRRAV